MSANALAAYLGGATGAGVKIAVIDSGLAANIPEWTGRIDAASRDLVGNRGVSDSNGHGTNVTTAAAGGRNGISVLGVAFNATVVSLNTSDSDCNEASCTHSTNNLARGVDAAVQAGARVINLSIIGSSSNNDLRSAISRATAAGIVVVIASGNSGAANPTGFAIENLASGNGLVIIAGAQLENGDYASYSNRAGSSASAYLTALGEVRTLNHKGQEYIASGTSMSAPLISGAVALLAQAFPHLTGGQIIDLLFASADDRGVAGVDSVWGNGALNIGKAFQPHGAIVLAGSGVPVSLIHNGHFSTAMGDATSGAAGAVILDGYKRAYTLDLGKTVTRPGTTLPLQALFRGHTRIASGTAGPVLVSFAVTEDKPGQALVTASSGLSTADTARARHVAGLAVARLTPRASLALGLRETASDLYARLNGIDAGPHIVSRDATSLFALGNIPRHSFGFRQMFGSTALSLISERGTIGGDGWGLKIQNSPYQLVSAGLRTQAGPAALWIGGSRLVERDTLLGGRFRFGGSRSTTDFLDLGAGSRLGSGWRAQLAYRRGWTRSVAFALGAATLQTDAYALTMDGNSVFVLDDRFSLRIAQPLRVRSGGIMMSLPISYDYRDGSVGYATNLFSFAPRGRETDFEASYEFALFRGAARFSTNLYLRREPGNIASVPSDAGGLVRIATRF